MSFLGTILGPLRRAAGRFVLPPEDLALSGSIFYKAAKLLFCEQIKGDYLEFGTFQGGSFIQAWRALSRAQAEVMQGGGRSSDKDRQAAQANWADMRFFGFDSFEGLSQPKDTDADTLAFEAGKFACSEAEFRSRVTAAGVDPRRVTTVPGWFDQSLTDATRARLNLRRAALVHIDVDLAEPAALALEFVTPLLQEGTVIVFDDWYCYRGRPDRGEQLAFRDWLARHPEWQATEYQKEGPWRNSFLIHARAQS
jgi:O-methyltransferase